MNHIARKWRQNTKTKAMILIPYGCLLDCGAYGSSQVKKTLEKAPKIRFQKDEKKISTLKGLLGFCAFRQRKIIGERQKKNNTTGQNTKSTALKTDTYSKRTDRAKKERNGQKTTC